MKRTQHKGKCCKIFSLTCSTDMFRGESGPTSNSRKIVLFPLVLRSGDPAVLKNLFMPLFLVGCFPVDFQEGKRPIKAFGETAH